MYKPKEHHYHSTMSRFGGIDKNVDYIDRNVYTNGTVTALQHDINSEDIPKEFYEADAIYVEMSWRAGYKKFVEGSVAEGSTFKDYCQSIKRVAETLGVPTFIITNRNFLKNLQPQRTEEILYDVYDSNDICAIWNYDGEIPNHSDELSKLVCNTYGTVLDFCCGYGRLADYGTKCILADINYGCIQDIKEHYKLSVK